MLLFLKTLYFKVLTTIKTYVWAESIESGGKGSCKGWALLHFDVKGDRHQKCVHTKQKTYMKTLEKCSHLFKKELRKPNPKRL